MIPPYNEKIYIDRIRNLSSQGFQRLLCICVSYLITIWLVSMVASFSLLYSVALEDPHHYLIVTISFHAR